MSAVQLFASTSLVEPYARSDARRGTATQRMKDSKPQIDSEMENETRKKEMQNYRCFEDQRRKLCESKRSHFGLKDGNIYLL